MLINFSRLDVFFFFWMFANPSLRGFFTPVEKGLDKEKDVRGRCQTSPAVFATFMSPLA